ncbi:dihydrofolate reductase family protein [Gordonia insulae]|uniref:Dihydrofolate reductase n=1 Tax=Gordonia insulae TaxID=2420509 RepID=A0A3G8JHX3_9ACTN|nr:dihydrofolate reductase family protein [Gordonia insulae]AZG44634.1 Dihydrofolate reductase [Gordonia insulae]
MTTARVRYYTATTLDGYLADQHDSLDWLLTQPIDEDGAMNYGSFIEEIGAMVMGYTTYAWLLEHEVGDGKPWPYDIPCFVFTHRDLAPVADSVRIVEGLPADHRSAIVDAAAGKDTWVVGGGDLAAQFADAGLLDEVVVSIAPVTLGAGRPLFPRRFDLELLEVDRNRAFVCARYAVVGPRPVASP